ncbi:MAG: lipopolysaccharide biosynthesis protein [Brevundimonas sp.]|jgi:O-antigen/teichoic acid export membrane protein|uniref:lipopolysaccharide biosynthesis protein n=1 Tax=Brevundimonas sp. TaxID=1871086 RepID=UPI00391D7D12
MFWRGLWGYLPANIVQGAVGFLAIVIFTRLLTPDDFGRYALAYAVLTLSHVAVFTWLEAAMARFWAAQQTPAQIADHFRSLYRTVFGLSALFVPMVALVLWLWPAPMALKAALAAGLLGVPVRCVVRLVQERYRAAGEVGPAARLDMAQSVLGLLIGVGFAWAGFGGAAPLIGLALAPVLALPFILPAELKFAREGQVDSARLRSYAAYGYPIAASLALTVILSSTDRFLLAAFMNEATVGAYHAGYSLANRTLDVMFIWLGAAGGPALVMALERGGREALASAAREQFSTFVLLALPACVGLMLVAGPLNTLMIGEALRADATRITPWIALAALLSGMTTYYFHQAFTLARRTGWLLGVMAIPALSNVVLNVLLIPAFGIMGAAWATVASFAVGLLASILIGRAVMPMPVHWRTLAQCGLGCTVMAVVVLMLPAWGGLPELLLKAAVGAGVYGVVVLALDTAGIRRLVRGRLLRLREGGGMA